MGITMEIMTNTVCSDKTYYAGGPENKAAAFKALTKKLDAKSADTLHQGEYQLVREKTWWGLGQTHITVLGPRIPNDDDRSQQPAALFRFTETFKFFSENIYVIQRDAKRDAEPCHENPCWYGSITMGPTMDHSDWYGRAYRDFSALVTLFGYKAVKIEEVCCYGYTPCTVKPKTTT